VKLPHVETRAAIVPTKIGSFSDKFRAECVDGSAIAPDIYDQAIEFIEDTGFWEPNHALNHKVSINWQTRKPHSFGEIACFINYDGFIWQAKPENPRIDRSKSEQKGETVFIRYEIPVGVGSQLYCPPVVALERYFELPEPITITEGGKKTLSLHSARYLAVGLAGCNGGYRVQDNGSYTLTPDVEAIAHPGREITIVFDQDQKPETVERVNRAITTFGKLLADRGCKVFVAVWDGSDDCKGIDDLIVNRGVTAWQQSYSNRIPFKKFIQAQQQRGKLIERKRTNERRLFRFRQPWENGLKNDFTLTEGKGRKLEIYEGYAPTFDPTAARTIAIQGGLGSGKTEAMLNSLRPSIANGDIEGAVWIATRNGLLRDTARRADKKGIKWLHFQDDVSLGRCYLRDGLDGSIVAFAYASLKEYHFTQVDWTNKTVVIDEESALRKEILNYPSLLPEFERMIKECKHLIVADAFLSNCDLKLIKNLRGGDRIIYKQAQKQDPTPVKWLETRTKDGAISFTHDGIYLDIIRDWAKQGLSFVVAADSAIHARVLEAEAKKLGIKTLLCWSKSIESNRSFLNRIGETLQEQKIQGFFYTPTIQNGADVPTRFDRVLVIAQGILSPLQMLQMCKRVRNAGEIWVSAPRKTADPASVILNPDSNRVKQLTDRVNQAFTEDSLNAPLNVQGWGVWERLTREIERGFNAEYIEALLQMYFVSVETIEVLSTSQKEWQAKISQLKLQDSERTLSAELTKGMDLLRAEKEPGSEADAWAIELAKLHQRYRKLTIKLQLEFHTGDREETLRTCNVLRANRTNKLKYWQIAEQANPDDGEMLAELVRKQPITYAAPVVKVRQYTELYRVLKLNRLACVTQKQELIPDQTCFYKDSPIISELWQQFQGDRKLQRLFPLVETQVDLWIEICKCFRFLGFEGRAHQARIKTTQAYPNGKYRDGRQRYSHSRTVYFKAWVVMTESGNEVFKKILPELIESINEDLELSRASWRKRQEEGTDPPWAEQAA
jgi:hypothetical protein